MFIFGSVGFGFFVMCVVVIDLDEKDVRKLCYLISFG